MHNAHDNRGFRVGLPDGTRRKVTPNHGVVLAELLAAPKSRFARKKTARASSRCGERALARSFPAAPKGRIA
jgi:hypothetical protein